MNRNCLLTVLLFFMVMSGCKKEEPKVAVGSITLAIQVLHHTLEIPYARVFLKSDATSFPGKDTTVYDWVSQADFEGKLRVTKLFVGSYYLYAEGFDGVDSVMGYKPVVLGDAMKFTDVDEILYVSE